MTDNMSTMKATQTRRMSSDERREQILEAALAVFAHGAIGRVIRGLFLEDWQPSRVTTVRARPGVLDIGLQVEVIDELEVDIAISAAAEMLDRRIAQAFERAVADRGLGGHQNSVT